MPKKTTKKTNLPVRHTQTGTKPRKNGAKQKSVPKKTAKSSHAAKSLVKKTAKMKRHNARVLAKREKLAPAPKKTMTKERAEALVVFPGQPTLFANRKQVVEIAAKNRLPAMYPLADYVNAGGLMSYGVINLDLFRRAATYVDKILKGAKPADLPVEQPTKFELIINLKTAKQIGLTIPPNVLARADRVIK